ncbi:hypothetical protein [Paenibacillus sp. FJAT-26967]|uniref:hypothetical protein n=1 Tax=Paenibacillus sp. FJAT-26967 TaxID=1729690 RepID=UPI000B228748|nr:hypothetical protein [Paenibacillus sp. FJAT-26967]
MREVRKKEKPSAAIIGSTAFLPFQWVADVRQIAGLVSNQLNSIGVTLCWARPYDPSM